MDGLRSPQGTGATPGGSAAPDVLGPLEARLRRHPYGAVAAALGVGYVLGGGVFTSLTSRLLGMGFRAAVVPILTARISALVEEIGGANEDRAPGSTDPSAPR